MTENVENLILEHLRAMRGTLSDHGERLSRIELRLSTIEQTLGSLYACSSLTPTGFAPLASLSPKGEGLSPFSLREKSVLSPVEGGRG